MSHWNYRVMRLLYEGPDVHPEDAEYFAVREVHYDENSVPYGYSEGAHEIMNAQTLDNLKWVHERLAEALQKPVLTPEDIKGNP